MKLYVCISVNDEEQDVYDDIDAVTVLPHEFVKLHREGKEDIHVFLTPYTRVFVSNA